VNAWLEEISFRAGVTALIAVAAIIIGGAIAVDLTAQGGGPPEARHAPAGQALPALPQTTSTGPASGPQSALPRLRHDARPPGHAAVPAAPAVPVAAVVPAAPQTAPANPASPPRPDHHRQRGFPGWSRWSRGWQPEHRHGWPHGHGHGWPHGHGHGEARGDADG
jgi:hypothetical protein